MEEKTVPKIDLRHELSKIFIWTLILIGGTVLISVLYKGIIEIGFFKHIRDAALHKFIFCVFEFFLIVAYWYYVYRFSKKCRHRSRSLKVYYIRIGIVFAVFAAFYWASFIFFSREVFMWIFRMTINLICFRFVTTAPENLIPYMIAYLVITLAIMMLEPWIAKARFEAWKREMGWSDDEGTL